MVVSVYVQPATESVARNREHITTLLNRIKTIKRRRANHELLIAGDFNRHDQLWGGDRVKKDEGDEIIELMDELGLQLALNRGTPTYENGSTLDLMLVIARLHEDLFRCCSWPSQYGSDHEAIEATFGLEIYDQSRESRRLFRNTNWKRTVEGVENDLKQAPLLSLQLPTPERIEEFAQTLIQTATRNTLENTPTAKPSPYAKRWWTLELTDLRRSYRAT